MLSILNEILVKIISKFQKMGKNHKIKENFGQKQRNESNGAIIDF